MMSETNEEDVPFCVDLDGTLLATDTLYEGIVRMMKRSPLRLLTLPFFLVFYGKARLKAEVARHIEIDVKHLPYNQAVVNKLLAQKKAGQKIVLATASNNRVADAVAEHLGVFDNVIASDDDHNLTDKAQVLADLYGEKGFDYVGNARADIPVWRRARRSYVVGPSFGLGRQKVERIAPMAERIAAPSCSVSDFVRTLRPHQWSKNILLFLPIIAAHQLNNSDQLSKVVWGFCAMCILASALYVFNDLLDLNADRQHAEKRNRPFAAGRIPIVVGLAVFPVLTGLGLSIGWLISPEFFWVLIIYGLLSANYSVFIKSVAILDVIVLAMFYVLRVVGGGVVANIELSFWLLSFSMFIFLSLAYIKRFAELQAAPENVQKDTTGRGYVPSDMELIKTFGITSGFISVLVLALYINGETVAQLYSEPKLLWVLCPVFVYWISHLWLITFRGEMHHDPVIYMLRDPISWGVGAACAVVYQSAI